MTQRDIAERLNFFLPLSSDNPNNFPQTGDPIKYGCNVSNLNTQLFIPLGIPLIENYYTLSKLQHIMDLTGDNIFNFVKKLFDEGNDIICSLDHAVIIGEYDKSFRHAILINSIDSENDITIITPTDNDVRLENVSFETLVQAIKKADGGFWFISED